jgi:hypothetical protein
MTRPGLLAIVGKSSGHGSGSSASTGNSTPTVPKGNPTVLLDEGP